MEDDFWNEYYEELKKLNGKVFIYVIDDEEVTEKEFMKRLIEKGQRKNDFK